MRSRLVVGSVLAAAGVAAVAQWALAATNFNVTAHNMSVYTIDGLDNPTLTLKRGQTYTFSVTAVGHPFWITKARGASDTEANAFAEGVTGNGASPGTITFAVPASAPSTLYYQCVYHDPMGGTLNIVSDAPRVPSLGTTGLAALAGLLLASAVVVVRRRQLA